MSDFLGRLFPGDMPPRRADTWNAILDVARRFRSSKAGEQGAGAGLSEPFPGCLEIDIQNDTGGTLLEHAVLKIGLPLFTVTDSPIDMQDRPAFSGSAPTLITDLVCVTQTGLSTGQLGRATLVGVCVCKINVTDAAHGFASPTASTTYLISGTAGFHRILYKESGTGTKLAVIAMNLETYVPDADYSVAGKINVSDQYLGLGKKTVYKLGVNQDPGSGFLGTVITSACRIVNYDTNVITLVVASPDTTNERAWRFDGSGIHYTNNAGSTYLDGLNGAYGAYYFVGGVAMTANGLTIADISGLRSELDGIKSASWMGF